MEVCSQRRISIWLAHNVCLVEAMGEQRSFMFLLNMVALAAMTTLLLNTRTRRNPSVRRASGRAAGAAGELASRSTSCCGGEYCSCSAAAAVFTLPEPQNPTISDFNGLVRISDLTICRPSRGS